MMVVFCAFVLFVVFYIGTTIYSKGVVYYEPKEIGKLFDEGAVYKVVASDYDHGTLRGDLILFVKTVKGTEGVSAYRGVRVERGNPPPKYFTMVDGKPVEAKGFSEFAECKVSA